MFKLRFIAAALLFMLLAACAPMRVRNHANTAEAQAAQEAREAALSSHTRWLVEARISISSENGGGPGDLTWRQDGNVYTFNVRGANGKTLRLSGDEGRAVLEGADPEPDIGSDPETLLRERLGAEVPFAALRSWALGLRAPGTPVQMQYDEHDLPAVLEQNGWTVEYKDWFIDRTPVLPRKVFASRGKAKVRLIIQSWQFND